MTKQLSPEEVQKLLEDFPVVEEGGEMLSSDDWPGHADVVLGNLVAVAIDKAKQGDCKAWGVLYAAAAAFMRAGLTPPQPLLAIMTERLEAIGMTLRNLPAEDAKGAVFDAAAPDPRISRRPGPKPKAMTADMVARDVLEYVSAGMNQKAATRKVSSLLPLIDKQSRNILQRDHATGRFYYVGKDGDAKTFVEATQAVPLYSADTLDKAANRVKKK